MMKIKTAKNPTWANASQTAITLSVKFEGIDEELPFTATEADIEMHGQELFQRAAAGEFGPVADFVAPPLRVPQVVSKFQGRAALAQAGVLQTVQAYMDAQPVDSFEKLAWDHAQEFRRQSPSVLAIGAALGMTEAELDELFISASTIQA